MKDKIMIGLVVVIFISFFLPWVSVESQAMGAVTKLLKGKEQAKLQSISGFQVPVLANSDQSKLMISIIKLFQPGITNADKKSYLIWGVPLLAVIMLFLNKTLKNNKWVFLACGIIGVAIFTVGTFKIVTTDLDKLVIKANIGIGLWLILVGYLGIGIIQTLEYMRLNKSGN